MIFGLRIAPSLRGVCSTRWSAATAVTAAVLCVGQLSARRTAARLDCPMHDTLGRCSAPHWSQASRRARTIGSRDLCQSKDIIKERQRTRSKAGGRERALEILCLRACYNPSSRFYAFESITSFVCFLRTYINFTTDELFTNSGIFTRYALDSSINEIDNVSETRRNYGNSTQQLSLLSKRP
uniref:Uncharacterized protein n=1 Tax=Trichogramma kaykai TaxID=54128 RepID=A0ABD2X8Q1_9HYME